MAKRKAATDLNHDNWDHEDTPEEIETIQEAPKEVVKGRVTRTAKRRLKGGDSSNNEPRKAFAGFAGFGTMKSINSSTVSEMGFLKKSDTPLKTNTVESKTNSEKADAHQMYLAKLKGLNEAVLDWIKQHVGSNPCCILTPVFRDYDNYLKEIQLEKDKSKPSNDNNKPSLNDSTSNVKETSAPTFSIASNNSNNNKETAPPAPFSFSSKEATEKKSTLPFSFGSKTNADKTASPTVSFGAKDSSEKVSSPFLFTSSKPTSPAIPSFSLSSAVDNKSPLNANSLSGSSEKKPFFSFGSTSNDKPALDIQFPSAPPGGNFTFSVLHKPAESSGNNGNDDGENDEEPQPEPVKPVTEDDAIHTQRVKVFVKKGESYSDLGVGNLFIKTAPNGWHQAIVRNETSLGNIILNILLSEQQPTKRLGKNNVMIVCQPTPQHSGPAVPVLLRVKTSDDADKLLETINKYKKK